MTRYDLLYLPIYSPVGKKYISKSDIQLLDVVSYIDAS